MRFTAALSQRLQKLRSEAPQNLRLRLIGLVALGVGASAWWLAPSGEAADDLGPFLAERFDLDVTAESVHRVSTSSWPWALGYDAVVFLASKPHEPRDLYRAEVRMTPEGRPLGARGLANLTRTSAGDEDLVVQQGPLVATRTRVSGKYTAITLVDTSGQSVATDDEGLFWRLLWAFRHTVEFGTPRGVKRHAYQLGEPADEVAIRLTDQALSFQFDGHHVASNASWAVTEGQDLVEYNPPTRVQTALVPFMVDTVRLISWIGPRGIEWMEHVFFGALDLGRRTWERMGGSTGGAEELAHEMATNDTPPPVPGAIDLADLPDVGFPPPPVPPIRRDPVEGEGVWRPMADPRFVRVNPGAPPAFATTFLRPDRERGFARTFVVIWDPRQIELYPVAGTVEPMSATGVRGSGLVPRDEVDRMVAGFNGGFQATHGEYGMMMEGTLFIPPKGYGATVASLADGRTGLGTWNEEVRQIPPKIVAFRQNMTALVQDGQVNPYGRDWWGAAPPGARDPTFTQRSGICVTEDHFIAYFWGPSLSPESLGAAMLAVRCNHGVHLDMNAILTGFEFYHVAEPEALPPLDRPVDDPFEGQGEVPLRSDLAFRARRLARGMKHMNFPRYVRRDTRDFFWLKLRHVLPGEPLESVQSPAEPEEGQWRIKGLPVGGFPPAFARTFLRPADQGDGEAEARVELVRLDPLLLRAAPGRQGQWPTAPPQSPGRGSTPLAALLVGPEAVVYCPAEGHPPAGAKALALIGSELIRPAAVDARELSEAEAATAVAVGGPALARDQRATLALGRDGQGFLVVAFEPQGRSHLLAAALQAAGVAPDQAVVIGSSNDADLVFYAGEGEARRAATLSGRPVPEYGRGEALLLYDGHAPQGVRLFPDVPAVRPSRWKRFLNKRQVYLRDEDGNYRHVTGVELPRQAPMQLRRQRQR
jgi:hypothetical protein